MKWIELKKSEGIAWLTLTRPESRNALSLSLMEEMLATLQQIKTDSEVRVVVIQGAGPAFCAGHDLRELRDAGEAGDTHQLRAVFATCSEMMTSLHQLPQPVIARVHGIATAAGCQLVAACDLAIAESGAQFSTPGVRIGLFCITPMVPLVRLIGRRRAMEMLLSGRFIDAEEAREFGLVNRVVEPDQLDAETAQFAAEIAAFSGFTLGFGKRAFYDQVEMDEREAYAAAREAMVLNSLAADAQEGIGAFLEKRSPNWKHQ